MNNLLFSLQGIADNLNDKLGIWYVVILNAIGVMAIVCKVIEYQAKKRQVMFTLVTIASACWVMYFLLYGNLISSATCLLGIIRLLIFRKRDTCAWARSIFWLYFFLALQVGVVVYSALNSFSFLDIFAILAGFASIFAYFVRSPKLYRIISLVHVALWVVNSSIYFYPIALISDSFSTISCAIAIFRYDILKKGKKQTEEQTEEKVEEQTIIEDKQESI